MNDEVLEKRLKAILQLVRSDATPGMTEEFAFHLRDCSEDLERYIAMVQCPSDYSDMQMKEALDGMLLHVVRHLVQAARLYGGFIDLFGADAVPPKPPDA